MVDEQPHRRREDSVSFRDMVEYVAESDARYHAARADSLIQISNAMEKSHEALEKAIIRVERTVNDHSVWHRDVLQGYLDRAASNRVGIISLVISALAVLVTVTIAIISTMAQGG